MTRSRIGVFGGTFDPPHLGHAELVRSATAALALQQVLLVLTANPPHRDRPGAPLQERLTWLQATFADQPRAEVSMLEADETAPSYSVDTLQTLHAEHPESDLVLLLGADQLERLTSWRDWQRVLELAQIGVAARPAWVSDSRLADAVERMEQLGARVHTFPMPPAPVSATMVRAAIREGRLEDVRDWLHPQVAAALALSEAYTEDSGADREGQFTA